jgi:DNA-binding response OmpR family regulator
MQHVVWVINAEHWPRALLRGELIEHGFDAVGFETVGDAFDALLLRPPDIIVVDVHGQPVPQTVNLLRMGVPVIVIAGELEIQDLPDVDWAAVLRRPIAIGEIVDVVIDAARRHSA